MDSAEQLRGREFSMEDGNRVVTEMIEEYSSRLKSCLDLIWQRIVEHQDMVVGLDITWSPNFSDKVDYQPGYMAVLAFCTHTGCAMTRISSHGSSSCCFFLKQFLDNKDITFVGVHIKDDLKRLRKCFGLKIKNAVDLSELAADVLHQPRLRGFGVRKLASEVLLVPFKARSSSIDTIDWIRAENPADDRLECATIDAYAAYKTGKKLLLGV